MKVIFIFSILTIQYLGFSFGFSFRLPSVWCWINKCCADSWDPDVFTAIEKDLEHRLYGQHIAVNIIINQLKIHLLNQNPKKALVLSLHGTTGSGKNYLTSITVERLAKEGMRDVGVKFWDAKYHFYDTEKIKDYALELREVIKEKTSLCSRAIFIFDEGDKLPSGLLDVLKPMMDEFPHLDGVDYRKTIFFFLSNTGSTKINEKLMEFKKQGKDRSTLKLSDFQALIQDGAFNEHGGFLKCKLIEKNLIDSYVPFLPLEQEHIKQCIKYYLETHRCPIDKVFIHRVSSLVNYEPEGYNYFSSYGCRGIDNLITQELEDKCIFNTPKMEL